jgi:hypothetical protein
VAARPCIEDGVSTLDQTTPTERELRQIAERAGWQIVRVYKDRGISGADAAVAPTWRQFGQTIRVSIANSYRDR